MHIQFNSDSSIEGTDALFEGIRPDVEKALARFADRITRLEIHVSDINAEKGGGDDIRGMVEVRREGQQPVAFTNVAPNPRLAILGAVEKAQRALDRDQNRATDRGRRPR